MEGARDRLAKPLTDPCAGGNHAYTILRGPENTFVYTGTAEAYCHKCLRKFNLRYENGQLVNATQTGYSF